MGKNHQYSENSGFIRLDGENIIDGQIDINSARLAIEGTQEVFEYFLKREDSQLQKADTVNFSIITRQGCWEILIPFGTYVAGLATTALATGINSYAKKYGDKVCASATFYYPRFHPYFTLLGNADFTAHFCGQSFF